MDGCGPLLFWAAPSTTHPPSLPPSLPCLLWCLWCTLGLSGCVCHFCGWVIFGVCLVCCRLFICFGVCFPYSFGVFLAVFPLRGSVCLLVLGLVRVVWMLWGLFSGLILDGLVSKGSSIWLCLCTVSFSNACLVLGRLRLFLFVSWFVSCIFVCFVSNELVSAVIFFVCWLILECLFSLGLFSAISVFLEVCLLSCFRFPSDFF